MFSHIAPVPEVLAFGGERQIYSCEFEKKQANFRVSVYQKGEKERHLPLDTYTEVVN